LVLLRSLGSVFAAAYFLAGCVSFSGYPERAVPQEQLIDDVKPVLSRDNIETCMDEETKACRNKIIAAGMLVVDTNFSLFEKALFKENRETSFAATVSTLGLNAAAAVNPSATLSAISAGIIGTKAAFDKEVLLDRAILAIHSQMRAQRDRVAVRLRTGMTTDPEEYPLGMALTDLEAYYQAGTLLSAFIKITESAGVEAEKADRELQESLISKFVKDDPGDRLRKFWKPDGTNVDKANEQRMRDWLTENNIAEPSLTFLLRSEFYQIVRLKMAKDLGLLK
jgi:hypothetical protein